MITLNLPDGQKTTIEGEWRHMSDANRLSERITMRIPLYSITDWHRSPISDSHPFDQPGT
ncbi:TPA: hypothetical protein NV992_004585 [Escherichia coli]|nr:hypothetical protein [Escherichia coli]HAV2407524.1 hypothetical protein [Escherichia coli]HCJ9671579.1 hypothetical protein [Escherichia coli]HCJ9672103.1 hypothetical protein [Escherichia coli]HCJ9748190.1 hypothetical protein [Escherichia coli]